MTIAMIVVILAFRFVSRIPERNKDAKEFLYLPDNPQEKKFCQKSYSFKQVFEGRRVLCNGCHFGNHVFHKGVDIATKMGVHVVAPADGLVSEISYDPNVGLMIKINHAYGMTSSYVHLLRTDVIQGTMVKRGDLIGYVGNSGRSTGSHLHYSVTLNNIPVNPRKYLD